MMTKYTCEEIKSFYLEESPSVCLPYVKDSGENNSRVTGPGNHNPQFTMQINHEVRTSMNAIMGFSQLLRQDSLPCEDRTAYTEYICQETENLLRIFNQLLELIE
jgi:nitrogen-specific signal transduction histidine kinase